MKMREEYLNIHITTNNNINDSKNNKSSSNNYDTQNTWYDMIKRIMI